MKVSLIIAAYNQRTALTKLFQGLSRQKDWPEEILIADDGSTDGTQEIIEDWRRTVAVPVRHHWQPNNGFGKLAILNKTVAAATGDYLIFTDGDCVPHPRFIADHRALAERGYWVQGRRCFVREEFVEDFVPGRTPVWLWALRGRISRPNKSLRLPWPVIFRDQEQRGIIGCNMAFWRDDILAVNGFDEAYAGRGMGADSDLGSRVYNLGRQRKFVYGRALVYHLDHRIMPRPHFKENKARLDEVIRSGKTWSERGVDRYLKVSGLVK
ncbi:MAG TPA: glycosyltransferase [Verrucomicrobiae bacterium]|nr:glycosyltransferase [Verrucomicrobiae bacterium]